MHPGRFRWLGRADNVVNSGGVKLHPEEIERKLNTVWFAQGLERDYFTLGLRDDKLGEKLVLIVEGEPITAQDLSRIQAEMHKALSPYEVPREIHFVPAFIRTETGKVRRKQTASALKESI
jgi:O-succinylbenzoic acid--CoA ligase